MFTAKERKPRRKSARLPVRLQWPGENSIYGADSTPRYDEFDVISFGKTTYIAFTDKDQALDDELASLFQTSPFDVREFARLTHNRPYYEFVAIPKTDWSYDIVSTTSSLTLWFRRLRSQARQPFPFELGDRFYLFDANSHEVAFVARLLSYYQRPRAATGRVEVEILN